MIIIDMATFLTNTTVSSTIDMLIIKKQQNHRPK